MSSVKLNYREQRGVGLLEVLVAVLVLGVGLLGMMGLQSESVRYNHNAALRARASMMANDMMDRIRANKEHAQNNSTYSASLGMPGDCTAGWPDACEGTSKNCSPAQLASWDVAQWKHQLACQLPGGDGSISFTDEPAGRVYTITIELEEMRTESNTTGVPMMINISSVL